MLNYRSYIGHDLVKVQYILHPFLFPLTYLFNLTKGGMVLSGVNFLTKFIWNSQNFIPKLVLNLVILDENMITIPLLITFLWILDNLHYTLYTSFLILHIILFLSFLYCSFKTRMSEAIGLLLTATIYILLLTHHIHHSFLI